MSHSVPSDTQWRKSTHSTNSGGQCVEVAAIPDQIGVRDSKDPEGAVLVFSRSVFRLLARGLH